MSEIRAENYTQRIIQGDSYDKSYTMTEEEVETGIITPVDITNKTVRGQLRLSPEDESFVAFTTSKSDSGLGVIDTFRITLDSSDTTGMQSGTWQYDIDLVDDLNPEDVQTIMKGAFILRAQVTR